MRAPAVFFSILFILEFAVASPRDSVLIVVNENSEESISLGNYYASKRGIPNMCRIRTSDSVSVSSEVFEREILKPVADCLRANSLQDKVLYIVTTTGVPMSVENGLLSVDSALTLTYLYMLTGNYPYQTRIENPYFAFTGNFRPFLRHQFDIYLVTRITSRGLVDRGLAAQSDGGFYFDLESPQVSSESEWVGEAVALLKKSGFAVTLENSANELNNIDRVMGYAAQRSGDAPVIGWRPGALATILHREAQKSMWSYIESGVTGLGAYVADPLPDGLFRPQLLFGAYTAGYNLAESFHASCRYLGSRQVVFGDPLVAPFAKSTPATQETAISTETGLPEIFSRRRMDWLMQKYSTSRDALVALLQAEAAEAKGDQANALSLVNKSLEKDPRLNESMQLKARLQAQPAPKPETTTAPAPSPGGPEETQAAAAENLEYSFNAPVRIVRRTPLSLPRGLRDDKGKAVLTLSLLIDEYGQVMKIDVVEGDRRLAKTVVEAVKKWRFEPKIENGRAVASTYILPISAGSQEIEGITK